MSTKATSDAPTNAQTTTETGPLPATAASVSATGENNILNVGQNLPASTSISTETVKQEERHDEAEIQELAAQIKAHNATLAKAASQQTARKQLSGNIQVVAKLVSGSASGHTNILNYSKSTGSGTNPKDKSTITRNGQLTATSAVRGLSSSSGNGKRTNINNPEYNENRTWDIKSEKGHFGWVTFGKIHIPCISRLTEIYCAVRMVEMKLLNKYINYLNPDIYSTCTYVHTYKITEAETRLLNEINAKHCDNQFGLEKFTIKDTIVKLNDVNQFYHFLDVCYTKLASQSESPSDKFGFIRINRESLVTYTFRNSEQVVPLFYFEGETEILRRKAFYLSGWDLAYLKFCCKLQGIRSERFCSESVPVICLKDIKSCYPNETEFQFCWPSQFVDLTLLPTTSKNLKNYVHWARQPIALPRTILNVGASVQNNVQQQQRHRFSTSSIQNDGSSQPIATSLPTTKHLKRHATAAVSQPPLDISRQCVVPEITAGNAYVPPYKIQKMSVENTNNNVQNNVKQKHQQQRRPSKNSIQNGQSSPTNTRTIYAQLPKNQLYKSEICVIPEIPAKKSNIPPYKMQTVLIENTIVPCINLKSYKNVHHLITLLDFKKFFFPNVPLNECQRFVTDIGLNFYVGNSCQIQTLIEHDKSYTEQNLLILACDLIKCMSQLRHMICNSQPLKAHSPNKTTKISGETECRTENGMSPQSQATSAPQTVPPNPLFASWSALYSSAVSSTTRSSSHNTNAVINNNHYQYLFHHQHEKQQRLQQLQEQQHQHYNQLQRQLKHDYQREFRKQIYRNPYHKEKQQQQKQQQQQHQQQQNHRKQRNNNIVYSNDISNEVTSVASALSIQTRPIVNTHSNFMPVNNVSNLGFNYNNNMNMLLLKQQQAQYEQGKFQQQYLQYQYHLQLEKYHQQQLYQQQPQHHQRQEQQQQHQQKQHQQQK